jgi:hypothetical protein
LKEGMPCNGAWSVKRGKKKKQMKGNRNKNEGPQPQRL